MAHNLFSANPFPEPMQAKSPLDLEEQTQVKFESKYIHFY